MILLALLATIAVAQAPTEEPAHVVVVRERAEPYLFSIGVRVDGQKKVSVPNRAYIRFDSPAGIHKFTLDWPDPTMDNFDTEISLKAGETTYLYLVNRSDAPRTGPNGWGGTATTFTFHQGLNPMPEEAARAVMAGLKEKKR